MANFRIGIRIQSMYSVIQMNYISLIAELQEKINYYSFLAF